MSNSERRSVWRAVLALRWRVLRRRFVSPLEATILLVLSGLAFVVGKSLGGRVPQAEFLAAGLTSVGALSVVAASRLAHRLLYGARELALLIPSGVSPRTLVRVRSFECVAFGTLALFPVVGFVTGASQGLGTRPSPLVLAAAPAWGAALGGLALLGAWLAAQLPARLPAFGLGVAAVAVGGGFALRPEPTLALLSHPLSPGAAFLALAGGDPRGLIAPCALGLAALVAADLWVSRAYARGIDRAGQRTVATRGRAWGAIRVLLRPLGQQACALLTRDLSLIGRGAFPRGVVILAALPLSLGVVHLAAGDPGTRDWHLLFVGLLVSGVLGSAAGFLFGVDFPRARRGQLLLERSQPVRARAVLISRWVPAIAYGALLVCGIAAIVAMAAKSSLARQWSACLIRGVLAVAVASHHAVVYGMRSESKLDPAEAAAYPLNGGVVVIVFACLLLWSPLGALAYPLIWFGFAKSAMTRWELAEIESMHGAAA